jgi:hypothetical protein
MKNQNLSVSDLVSINGDTLILFNQWFSMFATIFDIVMLHVSSSKWNGNPPLI